MADTIATVLRAQAAMEISPEWNQALEAQIQNLKTQFPSLAIAGPIGDRFRAAIHLVRDGAVTVDANGVGHVASRSEPGKLWTLHTDDCPCDDAKYGAPQKRCAHRMALGLYRAVLTSLPGTRDAMDPDDPAPWPDAPEQHQMAVPTPTHAAPLQPAASLTPYQSPQHSAAMQDLITALVAAQAAMTNPICDTTNPHFRNRYPSLAAVRDAVLPLLSAQGIAVTQCVEAVTAGIACTTTLWHTSGQWLSTTLVLPVAQQTPQAYGSAITYARRYTLMALCVVAGDEETT